MQYCSFSKLRVNVKDDTVLIFRKIFILIHMDFLLADLMWNPPSRFLRGSTGFDWQEDQKPCCHLVSYHLPLDTSPKWDFISIPDTTEDATPNAQAETVRWWVKSGVRGNNALSPSLEGLYRQEKHLGIQFRWMKSGQQARTLTKHFLGHRSRSITDLSLPSSGQTEIQRWVREDSIWKDIFISEVGQGQLGIKECVLSDLGRTC